MNVKQKFLKLLGWMLLQEQYPDSRKRHGCRNQCQRNHNMTQIAEINESIRASIKILTYQPVRDVSKIKIKAVVPKPLLIGRHL